MTYFTGAYGLKYQFLDEQIIVEDRHWLGTVKYNCPDTSTLKFIQEIFENGVNFNQLENYCQDQHQAQMLKPYFKSFVKNRFLNITLKLHSGEVTASLATTLTDLLNIDPKALYNRSFLSSKDSIQYQRDNYIIIEAPKRKIFLSYPTQTKLEELSQEKDHFLFFYILQSQGHFSGDFESKDIFNDFFISHTKPSFMRERIGRKDHFTYELSRYHKVNDYSLEKLEPVIR